MVYTASWLQWHCVKQAALLLHIMCVFKWELHLHIPAWLIFDACLFYPGYFSEPCYTVECHLIVESEVKSNTTFCVHATFLPVH